MDKLDRKDRVPEPLRNPPKRVKTSSGAMRVGGSDIMPGPSSCSTTGLPTDLMSKPLRQRQMQITAYIKSSPTPEIIAIDDQDAISKDVRIVMKGQEVPEEGQAQGHDQEQVEGSIVSMEDAEVKEDKEVTSVEDKNESQGQDHVNQGREDENPGNVDGQDGEALGDEQGEEQDSQHHVVQECEDKPPRCDGDPA